MMTTAVLAVQIPARLVTAGRDKETSIERSRKALKTVALDAVLPLIPAVLQGEEPVLMTCCNALHPEHCTNANVSAFQTPAGFLAAGRSSQSSREALHTVVLYAVLPLMPALLKGQDSALLTCHSS